MPMNNEKIKTLVVDELDNSLIANVISIGTQIAIVKASNTWKTAQIGDVNIGLKIFGSNP